MRMTPPENHFNRKLCNAKPLGPGGMRAADRVNSGENSQLAWQSVNRHDCLQFGWRGRAGSDSSIQPLVNYRGEPHRNSIDPLTAFICDDQRQADGAPALRNIVQGLREFDGCGTWKVVAAITHMSHALSACAAIL
jgi:hypothetical protein